MWLTTLLFPQGHSNGNRRYESDEDSLGSSGRVMRPGASLSWLCACLFQPLFFLSCHCCLPRHLTHQLKEDFAKEPVPLANTFDPLAWAGHLWRGIEKSRIAPPGEAGVVRATAHVSKSCPHNLIALVN